MIDKKNESGIMKWNQCEREFIRKVEVDLERVDSIKKKALQRLRRARETKIDREMVSFIAEDYYEVIKELLTSYLLKNGLRSKNHQCLISFFYKENRDLERESYLIQQMSFFRNRLNYYGEDIPLSFYDENKVEFERIVDIILNLIEDRSNKKLNGVKK